MIHCDFILIEVLGLCFLTFTILHISCNPDLHYPFHHLKLSMLDPSAQQNARNKFSMIMILGYEYDIR
jgi:hypothetical protein